MCSNARTRASGSTSCMTFALATIGADLAIDAARKGRQDEAIDELRASFSLHMDSGIRVFVGCPGEALVELLIDRGSIDDLTEAHRIVDQWQARRPGIPALDLWWLKSRALLAKAEGNSDGYAELATQYLELCEKLDARGRLDEARRMVRIAERRVKKMATILAYTSPALGSPVADQRTAVRAVPPWPHGPCAHAFHRCRDRPTARLHRGRDRPADRGDRARRLEGNQSSLPR